MVTKYQFFILSNAVSIQPVYYVSNFCDLLINSFLGANQQGDLLAAAQSGFGGSGYGCEQGVPTEAALLATLAAFAVSFGLVSSTF